MLDPSLPIAVYAEASNLFDTPYRDFASVPMPGAWLRGGITVTRMGRRAETRGSDDGAQRGRSAQTDAE